jgi:hypothetical protein
MWLDFLSPRSRPEGWRASGRPAWCRLTIDVLEDRIMPSFLAPVNAPGLNAVTGGDFNNDGNTDLIAVAYYQYPYWNWNVLLGKGDGTFQPGRPVDLYGDPSKVADLNGDGKLDLVTDSLGVQLGNGDGTFQAARVATLLTSQFIRSVAVGDMNGDGKPDLVAGGDISTPQHTHTGWTIYKYQSYVNVLLGNGDGSFQALKPVSIASEPGAGVALGDFNRDGKLDVLATSNGAYLLLGNGDGTLKKPAATDRTFSTFDRPAVADVNGDGKLDYMASYWIDLNAHQLGTKVYLGNGDGTFQPGANINLGSGNGSTIADFNHDGKVDLVAWSETTGAIKVFLGNGDGTFQAAQTFVPATGGTLFGLVLGDFNGDGYDDLALNYTTRNAYTDMIDSATLSVLLNDRHW